MKDGFNSATNPASAPRRPEPTKNPQPDIATKAEHDGLVEARREPAPALRLEPDAPERDAIDNRLAILREDRIRHLRGRLDQADEGLQRGIEQSF